MALKYNVDYRNIAKIGNKEIKFKPWTTKNEKEYLIAVESEEKVTDDMLFDILAKPCLEDPSIILSSNEQKMLMIEMRKKSLGNSFPMTFTCRKCNNVNDIDVEFDNIVSFEPESWTEVEVEDLKFVFGDIPSENLKNKLKETENKVEKSFIDFLIHIKEIHIDGKVEDVFTFEELKDFIDDIPSYIFDEAFKEFNKMKGHLEFKLATTCMACGASNNIDFEYLPNFLWT